MLAAQVHRRQVDPLHTLPRIEPGVEDGVVVGRADAGVVAADVDPAVAAGHLAVQRLDLVRGGDVGPHEHAAGRGGHRAAGVLVEVDHRHLRALGGEALAHGAADAAGAAGDDADRVPRAGGRRDRMDSAAPVASVVSLMAILRAVLRLGQSELMKTFLTSLNASSASGPSSRPMPDCFTPPKGVQ